jgi:Ca-activated chloride channel family protein
LFSFGIGSSVNRFLVEGMARAGLGEAFVITRPAEAQTIAEKFRKYISSPALTDITYDIDEWDVYDIEPLVIPDIFAERPVLLFGKWRGQQKGEITVTGKYGENRIYRRKIKVLDYQTSADNLALKYLWARQRIALLADYNRLSPEDERAKEITSLGLTYNLLTDYTSFVAIDTEVRSDGEKVTTVRQPLPLPQGVSDLAVGGSGVLGMFMSKAGGVAPAAAEKRHYIHTESQQTDKEETESIITLLNLKTDLTSYQQLLKSEIEAKRGLLTACYHKSKSYGISGQINIELILDKSGKVIEVNLIESDFKDSHFSSCLTRIIKNWQLSASPRNQKEKVLFVLKFEK